MRAWLTRGRWTTSCAKKSRSISRRAAGSLVEEGVDPRDALFEARRMFGNVTAIRQETQDMWSFRWIDTLAQDVRFGTRLLVRTPLFTTVAVLSLALGIGAAVAVFNVADAVLFRPLAVHEPQSLRAFQVELRMGGAVKSTVGVSERDFPAIQSGSDFADFIGFRVADDVYLDALGGGSSRFTRVEFGSVNYFDVLGLSPVTGRLPSSADQRSSLTPVVISERLWRSVFDADPAIVGKTIALNGHPSIVTGVVRRFTGLVADRPADIFAPLESVSSIDPTLTNFVVMLVARLRPGVSVQVAEQKLASLYRVSMPGPAKTAQIRATMPSASRGVSGARAALERPLWLGLVLVAVLVFVACANTGGLMLSRFVSRQTEFGVRVAIGADRWRLVRQLAVEALLVSGAAATVGLLLGWLAAPMLMHVMPETGSQVAFELRFDSRLVLFTVMLATTCAAGAAAASLVRVWRSDPLVILQGESRSVLIGSRRITRILVAAQVACSLLLVVGAVSMARSLVNLRRVDIGFDAARTFVVDVNATGLAGPSTMAAYHRLLHERLATLPGVERATMAQMGVFARGSTAGSVDVPGFAPSSDEDRITRVFFVGPDYFKTLGMPILAGRALEPQDGAGRTRVTVVNEQFAKFYFGSVATALERTINRDVRIVGVVANAHYNTLREEPARAMFVSYRAGSAIVDGPHPARLRRSGGSDASGKRGRHGPRSAAAAEDFDRRRADDAVARAGKILRVNRVGVVRSCASSGLRGPLCRGRIRGVAAPGGAGRAARPRRLVTRRSVAGPARPIDDHVAGHRGRAARRVLRDAGRGDPAVRRPPVRPSDHGSLRDHSRCRRTARGRVAGATRPLHRPRRSASEQLMALQFLRRAVAFLLRPRREDDLREEIAGHIELRRRSLIDEGMDPREAAYEARRMFGNVTVIREETRDMWSFRWFDTLGQDLRYGVRLLRRSPMFTAAAIGSLALGIGAAAAVFSLADVLLLRRLPVRAPHDLVLFRWSSGPESVFKSLNGNGSQTETEWSSTSFSRVAYDTLRKELVRDVDVFAFADLYRVNLAIDGRPEMTYGQAVSGNYFDVLGVTPAAGRLLGHADGRTGAPPAAVVGYDMWIRCYGGSHDAIGKLLVLNGVTFTIAGVMPRGFNGTLQVGQPYDVVVPLSSYDQVMRGDNANDPNHWWVLMMGRLKAGATPERLQPSADAILKQTVAAANADLKPSALPRMKVEPGGRGQTETRQGLREPIRIMASVVSIVLLVACANVANLLLARGKARARELAVRAAIGAPRRRIVRQLLTEGLLLGLIACAIGLVIARWITGALVPALAVNAEVLAVSFHLDARIFAFACGLAVACSVAFGLMPAIRSSEARITTGLQEHSRGAVATRRRFSAAATLVVLQVALSMLLMSLAGLLAWSAWRLQRVDPGFDASNLLTFSVDTSLNGYEPERSRAFFADALERFRALPGVTAASLSGHRLIANSSTISVARLPGIAAPAPGSAEAQQFTRRNLAWRLSTDDRFLQTMKIPVLRGRGLTPADSADAPPVAVINVSLAKQLFGTDEAVGRRFVTGLRPGNPEIEVVGVSADARYTSIRRDPPPTFYVPYQQGPINRVTFEVRTNTEPTAVVPQVRDTLRQLDLTLPIFDIRTQQEQILLSLEQERLFAQLAILLGSVTLALSGIGLYGLLAYAVTRRTPEIGVRMALGAERREVRWMMLRQSLTLIAIGLLVGIPSAAASSRLVESLLFNLHPRDPFVLSAASVVMLAVGLIAAYVPARRASRIDPLVALRAE